MNSEFHSLAFIFPSVQHGSFWFSPLSWCIVVGRVYKDLNVEALSHPQALWQACGLQCNLKIKPGSSPPAGYSLCYFPHFEMSCSIAGKMVPWHRLCFVKIRGASVTRHWAVTHCSLAGTVESGHCDLQAAFTSLHLTLASALVHSRQICGAFLSVDKIPVTFSSGNSRAQHMHTMDYLRLITVCLFITVTGSTNLILCLQSMYVQHCLLSALVLHLA